MRAEGEQVGATVYSRLMDHRLSHPLEETHELVHGFFEQPRLALLLVLEEQLRQAYVAGVSDGFAQGIAVDTTLGLSSSTPFAVMSDES